MTAAPIETDFQPTFYNPNEIKHRRRISSQQYGILEDEYQINTKPNASKRHYLAELLGMTPRTVQIWFQNKRAKAK
ncbi:Homeodomain-like protein, partial [Absidia repens]